MEISYLGKTAIKIKTKSLVLISDPTQVKDRADVVIYSNYWPVVEVTGAVNRETVFVVDKEGEYELAGVGVITSSNEIDGKKILTSLITYDGVSVAYLGGVLDSLSDQQLDKLAEVTDVLIVPLLTAATLIEKIQPRLAILTGYENSAELDKFFETNKFEIVKRDVDKIKIDGDSLPENTEVLVLNA